MMDENAFNPLQNKIDWQSVLNRALSHGGEWADLFWEQSLRSQLSTTDHHVHQMVQGLDEGIGIRIIANNTCYSGFTNLFSEESILELAKRLARAVSEKNPQIVHDLNVKKTLSKGSAPFLNGESVTEASLEQKLKILRIADEKAWDRSLKIKQVRTSWSDSLRKTFCFRSDGRHSWDQQSQFRMMMEAMGEAPDGKNHSASARVGGFWDWSNVQKENPINLVDKVFHGLKTLYRSLPAPAGTMPVVVAGEAGGVICHEAVGHGLEADYATEGLSVYANKMGEKVASSLITVIDDGTVPYARGTQLLDDEANPTQKNILIENGILKNYMFDQRTALKMQSSSTGNGRRESYKDLPLCRMTNTYIAAGKDDPNEILKSTDFGLYVAALGGGQVDTISGDFVFRVTEAYLIRNGAIAEPVSGATLAGNGPKVLEQTDRVGHDIGFDIGTCGKDGQWVPVTTGQPTIRIPEITVGGTVSMNKYFSKSS